MSLADKAATANGNNATILANVDKVYEAGKKAAYDLFWDGLQDYGARNIYDGTFYDTNNLPDWFYPKYDFVPINTEGMFRGVQGSTIDLAQRLTDCGVKLDTSKSTVMTFMFAFAGSVTRLPHISFESVTGSNTQGVFRGCLALKEIEKITLPPTANIQSTAFDNCTALEKIDFDTISVNGLNLQYSPLTHDSLMNMLNALADKSEDTSGTLWKVTIGNTNLEKLTDEELSIAWNKNWEVV